MTAQLLKQSIPTLNAYFSYTIIELIRVHGEPIIASISKEKKNVQRLCTKSPQSFNEEVPFSFLSSSHLPNPVSYLFFFLPPQSKSLRLPTPNPSYERIGPIPPIFLAKIIRRVTRSKIGSLSTNSGPTQPILQTMVLREKSRKYVLMH